MLVARRDAMRTLALLVAAATVVMGACARPPAAPPVPAEGDGRHLRNVKQLTNDGDNGEAYFSRDGKKLIFQSSRGGYACDKIWTMNADGSDKRMVSPDHGANTCSFFLPDGRIIYSSTSHLPGDCPPRPQSPPGVRYVWPLYPYDIYIADADGSNAKRITDNPKYDAEPVVSPDGKRIVFGSQREGDFDIYSMNIDGTDVRRLTDRVGYDGGPWWSPDGSKIVWRAWYPATDEERARWRDAMEHDYIIAVPLDLWVMDADGSNKRLLLRNGATNWAPSWHPDGRRIIFSSNKDDWRDDIKQYGHNFELYLINLDGAGLERLTFNGTFDSFPMFSPDGGKLVWGSNRTAAKPRQTDIYIADWVE
jgi:Tol biopolymer transport system component